MYYPDSFISEVRNAASVVEIIGGYVTLRKRGQNHVGLCPFHTEKTPSFNVSEERQWYHCFGCGAGGDIFKFMTQVENLSFPEAVQWLAGKYSIPIPSQIQVHSDTQRDREAILSANGVAERYFVQKLREHREGQEALRYLLRRGLTEETIRQFDIGYAPGGGGLLLAHLQQQGFAPKLLQKASLVKKSDKGSGFYDSFRRRIIFPIKDVQGRTIAFGGRVLDQSVPKYLNSSETMIYSKSRNLFGLHLARKSIRQQDHVILVEGYLDCIMPAQVGIRNVVASLGTGLTGDQVKILSRYTKNIVVNYDPDPAGVKATRRSLDLLLEEGFRVNVLNLPEGKDPDLFIRESGVVGYQQALRESIPYLEFITNEAVHDVGLDGSGRGKVKAINRILPFLGKVCDRVERLEYVSKIAYQLNIEDDLIMAELRKAAVSRSETLDENTLGRLPEISQAERDLILTVLTNEDLGREMISQLDPTSFGELRAGNILRCMCETFAEEGQVTFAHLEEKLSDTEDMRVLSRIYFEENMSSIQYKDAVNSLNAIKRMQLSRRLKKLQMEIERARADKDEEKVEDLHQKKIEIGRLIKTL